ncbi:MAG: proline iminopeptidase-family hydrolase [Tetrasphaera sp.]
MSGEPKQRRRQIGRSEVAALVSLEDEGFIEHRGHRVWWGATAGGPVPLLTIHGGPGICHDCLEPLAALPRRVVFYDQYGCGRSDRATRPTDYDLPLFIEEIDAVRAALGLERLHLFAHSYGGLLALAYLFGQPEGVVSLTLSNSFASVPALVAGWHRRLEELPTVSADVLLAGDPSHPAYGAALGEFVQRFVYRGELPEPVLRSMGNSGAEVYARMHGSSWFTPDGLLADVDLTDRLGEIAVPTLVIGGELDQCVPELAHAIHKGIPGSELTIFAGRHFPFFESPADFLDLVQGFLARAERAATA